MKTISNKTIGYYTVMVWVLGLFLAGCSSTPLQIARVDKNVEEGRLLPADALDVTDILNQYSHHYPVPKTKDMDLYIDVDKPKLFTQGDEVFMQLAMVTRPAKPAPVHVHALVYDEAVDAAEHAGFEDKILAALNSGSHTYDNGSSFSVDISANTKERHRKYPALQKNHEITLKGFLASYCLSSVQGSGQLYVLLLGDLDSLSTETKQDIVDMAKIVAAGGNKLSVLSYGEKPDFSFLTALARSGRGSLTIKNEFFHADKWVTNELDQVHAYVMRDIQLSLQTLQGVQIKEVVSPRNIEHKSDSMTLHIPEIVSGEQYIMLVKLAVSGMQDNNYRDLVDVKVQYYEPQQDNYGAVEHGVRLAYVMDRNDAKPKRTGRIARSKLIIATYNTLTGIPASVSANRNYKAMADLISQTNALEHFVQGQQDQELDRDIRILKKYTSQLRKFDKGWFKGWKKWKDMYFDSDRFTQSYD